MPALEREHVDLERQMMGKEEARWDEERKDREEDRINETLAAVQRCTFGMDRIHVASKTLWRETLTVKVKDVAEGHLNMRDRPLDDISDSCRPKRWVISLSRQG
jgi:hypothetical protein